MRKLVLILIGSSAFAQSSLTLAELEKMALANHPAIAQAQASIDAARGRRRQAGLWPNPTVGYIGDEIARTPVFNNGEHGAFIEQRIVLGGKLRAASQVAAQEVAISEAAAGAERLRVLNTVRSLYYQALGEQKLVDVRRELAALARRAVATTSELANVGQADRPDQLAVEVEASRLELGLTTAQNALLRTFRQLAAATGNPRLEPARLDGNIEDMPRLEFEQSLARITGESPELVAAQAGVARGESAIREARAGAIPDITTRAGAHYNRERLEANQQPVGWQSSFEVGINLPLFNRNQGSITAARADADRSRRELERTRLTIRSRLAATFLDYQNALATAERFQKDILPKAQRAYELYLGGFRRMAAAYPQVIISQRNLYQLQEDYVTSLITVWQKAVSIEGMLLRSEDEPMSR
jgi:cobalt-zinc-cadmium efflux system outer membrane protein